MLKEITINAILDYIEDNLEVSIINIDSLVSFSGYSKRYLQLLFINSIGISIGRYIQLRRVSRAAIFLQRTNLPISSISERLCYDSQQTFTREFKKNTGYTPLQYRKNKIWCFRKQTGPKKLGTLFPIPDIRYLDSQDFYGVSINYKEEIPFTGARSKNKWDMINSISSQNNDTVFVSHTIDTKLQNNEFFTNAIIWTKKECSNIKSTMEKGYYVYFSYKGTLDGYYAYIKHIYMNVLPFYGLQRKNSLDLEKITFCKNGEYLIEYNMPIA